MTHPLVNDEEELDRSAEHLVVARELGEPAGAVGPGYPKKRVQVLTQLVPTRPIRLPEIRWIHRPLRTLVGTLRGVNLTCEFGDGGTFGAGVVFDAGAGAVAPLTLFVPAAVACCGALTRGAASTDAAGGAGIATGAVSTFAAAGVAGARDGFAIQPTTPRTTNAPTMPKIVRPRESPSPPPARTAAEPPRASAVPLSSGKRALSCANNASGASRSSLA